MCTVTYLLQPEGFVLTSSRDEHIGRPPALPPALHIYKGEKLIYPRDNKALGSWIAMKENGEAAVLLNGAYDPHEKKNSYRRSRGLIFLDIFSTTHSIETFNEIDLDDIEPFTMVLASISKLVVCRWDGKKKHTETLVKEQPFIWSSCTLYTPEVIREREVWFSDWLQHADHSNQDSMLQFHHVAGGEDVENNVRMRRKNEMLTISITSILVQNTTQLMYYYDTQNGNETWLEYAAGKIMDGV